MQTIKCMSYYFTLKCFFLCFYLELKCPTGKRRAGLQVKIKLALIKMSFLKNRNDSYLCNIVNKAGLLNNEK